MSEVEEVPNEPAKPTLEERLITAAKEQGWREDGPLDAAEFIVRGSQYHRDMKKTVDEVRAENKKAYGIIAEHITQTQKREFQRETVEHEQRLRAAAEAGDAELAVKLAAQAPKPPAPPADPKMSRIDEWAKAPEQKWFQDNDDMRVDALAFYQAEITRSGVDDPDVILPKVEARIKKLHADYFKPAENPNRQRGGAETGGKLRTGSNSSGLSVDDLDADEKLHFAQLKELGLDEKKMLKSIAELRSQRRG